MSANKAYPPRLAAMPAPPEPPEPPHETEPRIYAAGDHYRVVEHYDDERRLHISFEVAVINAAGEKVFVDWRLGNGGKLPIALLTALHGRAKTAERLARDEAEFRLEAAERVNKIAKRFSNGHAQRRDLEAIVDDLVEGRRA